MNDLLPVLERVLQVSKNLVIVAEDLEGEAWQRWSSTSCAVP